MICKEDPAVPGRWSFGRALVAVPGLCVLQGLHSPAVAGVGPGGPWSLGLIHTNLAGPV